MSEEPAPGGPRVFGAPPAGVTPIRRPGAYGIARRADGRVAVAYTVKGVHLPGGGVDPGESDEACLRRETLEELGLDLGEAVPVAHCVEYVRSTTSDRHYEKRCTFFRAPVVRENGGGEPDHVLGWLTPERAWRDLRTDGQSWAVAEAFRRDVRIGLSGGGRVRAAGPVDRAAWTELRGRLWPEDEPGEHDGETASFFARGVLPGLEAVFVAESSTGRLVGFAEASVRRFVDGCRTDRVAYLEGWYVTPAARRTGVGGALVEAVAQWGTRLGCTEMASDSESHNLRSLAAHRATGFSDVASVRLFRRAL